MKKVRVTIGTFEKVNFPEFGVRDVVAKIDTGAYSGAIHCTMHRLEYTEKGRVLYFYPFNDTKNEQHTSEFVIRHVTSSNGDTEKRYFINTKIEINGVIYPIRLSLADRKGLNWKVLIGRRFLRRQKLVVDARRMNK